MIYLAGLETSGGKAEVRSHCPGAFKPSGVINCCLEGQRSDITNPWRRHQALTHGVLQSQFTGSVIQFTMSVIEHQTGFE